MGFLNCVMFLLISGLIIFIIGRIFPRKYIYENKFPFKSYKFEKQGSIYNKLKIKKWKTKMLDASVLFNKIMPKILPKKRINNNKKENIEILIKETCVAEMTHFVAGILGLLCIRIWRRLGGKIIAILYLLWNMMYVIIQRYNRPRLINTYNKMK